MRKDDTMEELQILNIGGIDCYEKDGTAYLRLDTVARGLGFTKTEIKNGTEYTTVRWDRIFGYLDEIGFDHKRAKDSFVPENIFYRLAMKAKNAVAEVFQAKIADEVIPAIRKTGGYIAATPEMTAEEIMARAVLVAQETIKRLDGRIKSLQAENAAQKQVIAEFEPIRQYVDTILSSARTLTVTQIAADYGMSANKLNKILHEAGLQRKVNRQWILYNKYMNLGYTKSRTIHIVHKDGTPDTTLHTEWTQKGRLKIHEILTSRGIVAVMDRKK